MKRSDQLLEAYMANAAKELTDTLAAESVEALEIQLAAKDVELAVSAEKLNSANTQILDLQSRLAQCEGECENMRQYQTTCSALEATLSSERQARLQVEQVLKSQISEEVTEETKVTGVKVRRSDVGLISGMEFVYS